MLLQEKNAQVGVEFPGGNMAWHGVSRVIIVNSSKPMVGCKGEHPHSVGLIKFLPT
jgi:hypothetical protein